MEPEGTVALRITRGVEHDPTYVVGCRNSRALQRPIVQRACHDACVADATLILVSIVPVAWLVNGSGGFPFSIGVLMQDFADDAQVIEREIDKIPELRSISWEFQLCKAASISAGLTYVVHSVRAQELFIGSGERAKSWLFRRKRIADRMMESVDCKIIAL